MIALIALTLPAASPAVAPWGVDLAGMDPTVTADQGCAVETPAYGQAGPPADFILSTAGGYTAVEGFAGWPHPAMVRRRDGRDVLDYDQGGFDRRCGVVTTAVWAWDGRGMNVVERRNDRGDRVDADGCEIGTR